MAAAFPSAVALVFENERLTYKELNDRATQVSDRLRRRGVAPDMFIGVYIDRSIDLVVAIMKAGGAARSKRPNGP